MAVAVTVNKIGVWGDRKVNQVTLSYSGSYPTGGETLTPASCGLNVIEQVIVGEAQNAAGTLAYPVAYRPSTGKTFLYTSNGAAGAAAGLAEHPNGAYTAGISAQALVVGY